RAVGMTMSPLPASKRKRRFAKIEGDYVEDVDSDEEDDDAEEETSVTKDGDETVTAENTDHAG
ncbi:MAG: hypothetical protein ACOYOI_01955, partial [Chthoniobacterales bacterium]